MRVNVVRIGNSRGVRIPKALLEQCGIGDAVDLTVEDGKLVARPLHRVRAGWAEAAGAMAARGDDRLIDPETPTAFDADEWES
jgi:antitoxin MazE